ncbi:MAG TPA: hypothetical protein DEG17_18675 [Cyanobacteria bacterium UBA11149]|nr:hypothetical protein [Cyanobacteria bacterium UBA11367]HBE57967.1 hypothetical protein [Cyanobacteria bacterium UBA11366]HBK62951.1 hypothetical protein [Cyanobacteria bacterium UBA11166]HBR74300.1 hypothetical protein [Cyanobacteria bacterium UBA11159]HBS69052.1 hypothetical protein [Cyanobacteria bacterium UBA11153]HBW90836.1 hypothetical protein [Cyanobacteria bacterium UBA11149]HCA96058.1 hypothetical protein [Cyanobacteria bacterium UBA9226]
MFKKIHIFLTALIFVVVITGQQVQAQLTQATPQPTEVSPARIQVQRIEVKGSTLFGEAELKRIIKPLEGRSVTLEELNKVVNDISQLYFDRGYITSEVDLVKNSLSSGFIEIQVSEATGDHIRNRIRLSGNSQLRIANASLFERLQRGVSIESSAKFDGNILPNISQILAQIEQETGTKYALIYARFQSDYLELRLVTAQGKSLISVVGATESEILTTAAKLTGNIIKQMPYLSLAKKMYQWLIAPLQAELESQKINNLVFIMAPGLRSLPIAALHDGEKFLVEKYSIGLMPSFGLTDTSYRNIQNEPVLAMGISEINQNVEEIKQTQLGPLPAVPNEIDTIVELRGGKSLLNEQVTLENLKRESQDYSIVHLETHGEFEGEVKNSYMLLWDRLLRLNQIRELGWNKRQSSLELLVLSACKTALGNDNIEFGFAGLAVVAGVKSVLGSLWYVSDEGTAQLMTKFYQQLKTAPIKSEALRQAQLAMIQSDDFKHPYYWSAFTMIGSPW